MRSDDEPSARVSHFNDLFRIRQRAGPNEHAAAKDLRQDGYARQGIRRVERNFNNTDARLLQCLADRLRFLRLDTPQDRDDRALSKPGIQIHDNLLEIAARPRAAASWSS